jgi:hypothetical protein
MIYDRWDASNVHRWHTARSFALRNSGDTNAAHTHRCVTLLVSLWPESTAKDVMIMHIHDHAEKLVGDVSGQTKVDMPELKSALDTAEQHELARIWPDMPLYWTPRHQLCDKLDAYLWMLHVDPAEAQRDDWLAAFVAIESIASGNGLLRPVRTIIADAY